MSQPRLHKHQALPIHGHHHPVHGVEVKPLLTPINRRNNKPATTPGVPPHLVLRVHRPIHGAHPRHPVPLKK